MGLGETGINYTSRVHGISQRMPGVSMEKIIPLFTIASLDQNRYLGVKSRYLSGDPALINCNPLNLSGLLSSEETRKQVLGLLRSTPPAKANHTSDNQAKPLPIGPPQPHPSPPMIMPSPMDYPLPRGVPWKCIATMVCFKKSCPGCYFNNTDDPPASSSTNRLYVRTCKNTATYAGKTSRRRKQL